MMVSCTLLLVCVCGGGGGGGGRGGGLNMSIYTYSGRTKQYDNTCMYMYYLKVARMY